MKRKNYTHKKILDYWSTTLLKLQKGDSDQDLTGTCFACGWIRELQKAHITPLCENGSDEISNLHLLCTDCHIASEWMKEKEYWEWLSKRNPMSLIKQLASYKG